MIVYWLMFAIPALLAVILYQSDRRFVLAATMLVLAGFFFIMAFRENGGDYYTYNLFYEVFDGSPFGEVTDKTDFLYGATNWIAMQFDWGLYGVNAICAVIFLVSFYMFVRHEPYPLLSLAIAASYFIIVVAIGYTRQGVAAGLLLWGTVFLRQKKPWKYLALQLLAIGFHTSAAFALIFIYFALNIRNVQLKRVVFAGLLVFGVTSVLVLQADVFQRYMVGYVSDLDYYSSDGAAARLALSWVAAATFFIVYKFWPQSDRKIWTAYALLSLLLIPILAINSTIADRLGLYVIALQIAVFGRLPMFGHTQVTRTFILLGTIAVYAAALGVWLELGNFAKVLWLPYQNYLFGVIP
ncbi:EpsG family protein [Pontixanthobacter aquaemixtae]|uniref:EpsG family protein n=1 Tax=Pontixanthobacter aquaemixtae TaxID=1958940 RepID=A0A844ZSQ1_9SPHN|nr:EpsG family protein [Pontixanthobacter aquaemixtae]MXO91361.1 hypothetical protein [Pontixanthobacter aquaemixtae]